MTHVSILWYISAMTLESFRNHLRKEVERAGSQRKLAKELGVSAMFVNDVLRGRRDPGKKMLDAMGFQRQVKIIRLVEIKKRP